MPISPTRNRSAVLLAAAAALTTVQLGCASTQHTNQPTLTQVSPAIDLSELWVGLYPETSLAIQTDAPGPSLVAGDWLAWQCAYAGGYFDMDPSAIAAIQTD